MVLTQSLIKVATLHSAFLAVANSKEKNSATVDTVKVLLRH
jgi:hypothetical protein